MISTKNRYMTVNTSKKQTVAPAVGRAQEFLRTSLGRGEWHRDGRLPALGTLASMAGVSRNSMWKALGPLKDDNTLTVIKGGKILVAMPNAYQLKNSSIPLKRWESKRNRLAQDIINGKYSGTGQLPIFKDLMIEYGVCKATLKKILDSLISNKIVLADKKSLIIPCLKAARFRSTIVVLSRPVSTFSSVVVVAQRMQKLFDALETECMRAGFNLEFVPLNRDLSIRTSRERNSVPADQSVIGYIVNLWLWLPENAFFQTSSGLIERLKIHKKPIAVFDHIGLYTHPASNEASAPLKIFKVDEYAAGRNVAEILLQRGHKRIAFISLQNAFPWSKERLAGFLDVYRAAGLQENVVAFCDMQLPDTFRPIYNSLKDTPDGLEKAFDRFVEPLFDQILDQRSVTAWVGADDHIALAALRYLQKSKVQVPNMISVLGFDNSPVSFENQMSSYDFNLAIRALQMLRYVIRPDDKQYTIGSTQFGVEGMLIERSTTSVRNRS
jgi:DNA-binding transcriptional regulator YhcF (GntR family)